MLLRIFGLESEAAALTDADATLAKFTDAASISSWAKNAVAYAVGNGLVQGYPDGSFGPKAALNGKAYCTLILKQLGYAPNYNNAPNELLDKDGKRVIESLVEKEVVDEQALEKVGLNDLVSPIPQPVESIGNHHSSGETAAPAPAFNSFSVQTGTWAEYVRFTNNYMQRLLRI